ncbi:MAG: cupin domain-containing protein [Candidatus Uhrbacteria bacterium]
MSGFFVELEQKTVENTQYREVLFTGPKSQLVVMSIAVGDDIGMEVHEDHDQFIRVEAGEGKAIIDSDEFALRDGSAVVIPAGAEHNIVNTSESAPLKLYTIYTPPEHPDGTIHETKADASK